MPHADLDASVVIQAPAHAVFDRMNDLSRLDDWNPVPSMDPTTVTRHEGARAGVGAIFHYEGQRLGKGCMEIISVDAPRRIDIAMPVWRGDNETQATSASTVIDRGDAVEAHWTFGEGRGVGMHLLGKLLFDRMLTRTCDAGSATTSVVTSVVPAATRSNPASASAGTAMGSVSGWQAMQGSRTSMCTG